MQLKTRWLWCALASMMCGTVTKAVAQDDDGGGIIVDAAPAVDFWVATWGNDSLSYNQSTPQTPFKTILRAQYAVRQYRANNPTVVPAIVVHIAGGEYSITHPLVFEAQDSGWANWPIRYIAWDPDGSGPLDADVLISGGYTLTNWVGPVGPPTPDGSFIYQTQVPELLPELHAPRDLWVNGRKCPRARFPNPQECTESWNNPAIGPCYGEAGEYLRGFMITQSVDRIGDDQVVTLRTPDGSLIPTGVDWSQVEAVGHQGYVSPRQSNAVASSVPGPGRIRLTFHTIPVDIAIAGYGVPIPHDLGAWGAFDLDPSNGGNPRPAIEVTGENLVPGNPTQAYFENAFQFIDRRYEWSFDKNSRVLSIALCAAPGTGSVKVTVPVSNKLLIIDRAAYLSFEGIDFAYAYFPFPKLADGVTPGYSTVQAGHQWLNEGGWPDWKNVLEGAIWLRGTLRCDFLDCKFGHMGGSGVVIDTWRTDAIGPVGTFIESHYNRLLRCEVFDVGGHGVWIGDELAEYDTWQTTGLSNVPERSEHNKVEQSFIHHYGMTYKDAAGVYIAHTRGTRLTDCEISWGPWTGVSVTGVARHKWDAFQYPSPCHPNTRPAANDDVYIARCDIHNTGNRLNDGGGIYMFGTAKHTTVSWLDSNYIHDVRHNPYFPFGFVYGLAWDFGGSGWMITGNYIETCQVPFGMATGNFNPMGGPPAVYQNLSQFGAPTYPIAFTSACWSHPSVTTTFEGMWWIEDPAMANRWLDPINCRYGNQFGVSCFGEYAGFECGSGWNAIPAGAVVRDIFPNMPDTRAQATMAAAGPDNSGVWFPGFGERIYESPTCESGSNPYWDWP